mmetsp:Transcript_3021/g.4058  ORF Transcript_3021/g.4058 Transcript_3021/m.4058 type:complete len:126 (-) Transcript_3021:21-398(-)
MTTPVLMNTITSSDGSKEEKEMSFVLPSDYWKDDAVLSLAPRPLEGSGVTLKRLKGSERAVIMFGGYTSKKLTDQQSKMLLRELEKDGKWQVVDGESVSLAQYNDPFTPPWKRLNEVSIEVRPKQ